MSSSSSSSDEYTDWIFGQIELVQSGLKSSWDYLSSPSNNLHDLPSNLQTSLNTFMDKLSLNGTLPTLPEWKPLRTIPPPPPPPTTISHKLISKLTKEVKGHPYITSILLTTTTIGLTYYIFPKTVTSYSISLFKPLKPFIPIQLLPTSERPKRVTSIQTQTQSSQSGSEIRKEVALVLGAEGLGREIAIDLEKRGFVVICTVRFPNEVDALEKTSLKGFMKVLVLDPNDSSSVAPFLRSLSTALSLRYPIHSSGDPFARPSHSIALTSVINCLSLSNDNTLCPLEGMEIDLVKNYIGERAATLVGVLKGILPVMRSMALRPNAPEGIIISLIPSNTSNFSLPFLSLSSASDSTIVSILNSLRRELQASKTYNLRSTILETGFFELPSTSLPVVQETTPLTARLSALYEPSLSLYSNSTSSTSSSSSASLRSPSSIKVLTNQIIAILFYGKGNSLSRIGSGSNLYSWVGIMPNWLTDGVLGFRLKVGQMFLRFSSSTSSNNIEDGSRLGGGGGIGEEVVTPKATSGGINLPPTNTNSATSLASSTTSNSTNQSHPIRSTTSFFGPNINDSTRKNHENDNPFLFEEGTNSSVKSLEEEEEEEEEEESRESSEEEGRSSFGSESGMGSFVGVESEEGWSSRE